VNEAIRRHAARGAVEGNWRAGYPRTIVVASGESDEWITNEQKTALDALHLRRIDLADRVLVVNPGGYIGESTSREIAYARATGKPISFTDPV